MRPLRVLFRLLPPAAVALLAASLQAGDETPTHLPTLVELPSGKPAEQQTLTPWDALSGDRFGHALAADGDWLLASTPRHDLQGRDSGSVAVFQSTRAGWRQTDRLEPSDGRAGDYFGFSLALDGNLAVVGSPWDDDLGDRTGSVYVFEWNGEDWLEQAKLTSFDAQPDDRFGHSVALDGGTLVVGARMADEGGRDNGAVYVFERNATGWRTTAKILSPDVTQGAEFGFAVDVEGDLLAVGAWSDDHASENDGSVHLFRRGEKGWEQEAALFAQNEAEGGCFGISVDLQGERCAVGAPWESVEAPRSGAAYVFRYDIDHWVQEARVIAPTPRAGGTFGIHVRLSGAELLVGSRRGSPDTPGAGAVDIYGRRLRDWVAMETLFLEDSGPGDDFGLAIATLDGWWLVGCKRGQRASRRSGPGLVRAWRPMASVTNAGSSLETQSSSGNGPGSGRNGPR